MISRSIKLKTASRRSVNIVPIKIPPKVNLLIVNWHQNPETAGVIDAEIKFVVQIHDHVYVATVRDQEIDLDRQGNDQEVHDEITIGKGRCLHQIIISFFQLPAVFQIS